MAVYAVIFEKTPFLDNNGNPLSGGLLYTYSAGTSTPKPTFTESDGLTQNPNPIVLNSRGEIPNGIYGNTGAYKLVLQDSLGVTIWTRDNVSAINDIANSTSEWQSIAQAATYLSANSFSLPGDQTQTFHAGRRVKLTDGGGTKYGSVYSSTYSTSTTIVLTMDGGSSVLASLSSVQVGLLREDNPSFPQSGPGNSPYENRNRSINGSMIIDQRNGGASQSFTAGAALAYCVDRFYGYCTGANVTGQRIQNAAGKYRYRFTGLAGNTSVGFAQRHESSNVYDLCGNSATFSVKLSSTSLSAVSWAAYYANTADAFGTLASPTRTLIASGNFSVSSTEQLCAASFFVPAAAKTGIEIVLSTGPLLAAQTLDIGEWQFEQGNTVTPHAYPFLAKCLQDCQRYFEGGNAAVYGYAGAGGVSIVISVPFKVTKRAVPTLGYVPGTNVNVSTFDARVPQVDSFFWYSLSTAAGSTAWAGTWTASAEL